MPAFGYDATHIRLEVLSVDRTTTLLGRTVVTHAHAVSARLILSSQTLPPSIVIMIARFPLMDHRTSAASKDSVEDFLADEVSRKAPLSDHVQIHMPTNVRRSPAGPR